MMINCFCGTNECTKTLHLPLQIYIKTNKYYGQSFLRLCLNSKYPCPWDLLRHLARHESYKAPSSEKE